MTNKVYDIITEKITKQLEAGVIPWQKPWKPADAPRNIRGTRYTGINVFLLAMAREANGYTSNVWMTFKQATELKGDVTGQKTTMVIFCKPFETVGDNGKTETHFSMRYYNVFNADQVKGITLPKAEELPQIDPIESAEMVVSNMPNKPEIKHGGDNAYYASRADYVQLPPRETFKSAEFYYSVLFHELGHSTGHSSRLGRFESTHDHTFGSQDYSKEELVAEMTAAYVCGFTGLDMDITNSTAYIQSWLKALNDDKTLVIKAASAAQKAADYITGQRKAATTEE